MKKIILGFISILLIVGLVWGEQTFKGTLSGSGTFTADETATLTSKVPNTRTINGYALTDNLVLDASSVGLGNVNNTSDANKPVSTAQQTALDLKANLASPTFTGTPTSITMSIGSNLMLDGMTYQSFVLRIVNNGGLIQHHFVSDVNNQQTSNFMWKVNGATSVLVTTPSNTDASTAMANGGKISSAALNNFILDVAEQNTPAYCIGMVTIEENYTVTFSAVVRLVSLNRNVNGVSRQRLEIAFSDPLTGAVKDLTTIPLNTAISIRFSGWIR